jgi:hypothetical protein
MSASVLANVKWTMYRYYHWKHGGMYRRPLCTISVSVKLFQNKDFFKKSLSKSYLFFSLMHTWYVVTLQQDLMNQIVNEI